MRSETVIRMMKYFEYLKWPDRMIDCVIFGIDK